MNDIEVLVEGELKLAKGNLIKTLPQVSEEYKVTFDFTCNSTNNNWGNVIHFTTQDTKNSIYGQHIPTVYYNGSRFEIDSSVNGNYIYLQKAAAAPNVWHSVEVCQEKVDGDFVYSVVVDGNSIHTVVNNQPQVFQDVKVYASDPWQQYSAGEFGGRIRNLKFFKRIDSELQCSVCEKMISEPTMLDCCCTFCGACVQKMVADVANTNGIVCPVCGITTPTQANTSTLWKNDVIQKKLDVAKLKSGGKMKCIDCERSLATKFCFDCKCGLCDSCTAHHSKCARYEGHRIDDVAKVSENDLLQPASGCVCTKHSKAFEYFCEQCEIATCIDCTHSKIHRGHEMVLMDELLQDELGTLKDLIKDASVKWSEYEAYLTDVEGFIANAVDQKEKSSLIIEETFKMLFKELQRQKEEQLEWLSGSLESSMESLKKAKEAFAVVKGRSAYLEKLVALPSEGLGENILQARCWMADTMKQVNDILTMKDEGGDRDEILDNNVSSGDKSGDVASNKFTIDHGLLTARGVSGLNSSGEDTLSRTLEGLKNISFERHVLQYDDETYDS